MDSITLMSAAMSKRIVIKQAIQLLFKRARDCLHHAFNLKHRL
mgnify:CR=1 FL=1